MADTLMTLGEFRFSMETAAYSTLQRTARYQWSSQARLGRKPAQQFTGKDPETITLNGVILPHFKGGLGQVNSMRKLAGDGVPLNMSDGLGNIWGKWCITEVRENQSDFTSNGAARSIRFSLTLVEYGEDDDKGYLNAGRMNAIQNQTGRYS